MERTNKRVLNLTKAVCRLHFYNDLDASDAIEELNEQGFCNVNVDFVQEMYDQLIKETKETITIAAIKDRVFRLTSAICSYYPTEESDVISVLEEQDFDWISADFIRAVYDQLEKEMAAENQIELWRQNAERSLFYTCAVVYSGAMGYFMWSQRNFLFFKSQSKSSFHEIQLFDLYNDKSIEFTIKKSAPILSSIYSLSDWFGILVECDETGENIRYFVSLIVLDLYRLNCKKIHTVEYVAKNVEIYVNELNPATFVMGLSIEDQYVAHICKIAGQTITKAKIIVGDPIQLPLVCDYSDGVFHSFIGRENEYELIRNGQIFLYDTEQQKEERLDVDLPDGYYASSDDLNVKYIRDSILFALRSVHGGSVIARLDIHTHQWIFVNFATENWIRGLGVLARKDLIVGTYECEEDEQGQNYLKFNFYMAPIRKPELLRNMAWLTLVRAMKKRQTLKGAYESARRYLPYNSDIRCPFVEPEEDEKN